MHAEPIPRRLPRTFLRMGLTLMLACAWLQGGQAWADVVVTPAPGEAVRLNGPVVLPAVPGAAQQAQAVCINAGGQLGPCGGSGSGGTYTAGTGLVLSPTGEFSIAPSYQLPQGCASHQAVQWNGSAFVCATPATTNLPSCQFGEVLRFGTNGVTCGAMQHITTPVSVAFGDDALGSQHAGTMGTDGLPLFVYFLRIDNNNGRLARFKCANRACSTGVHSNNAHASDITGVAPSVAMPADGRAVISHRDSINGNVLVSRCINPHCTDVSWQVLDSNVGGGVGETSIAIGADGLPVASYFHNNNQQLRFARCTTADCSAKIIATVDSGATNIGIYNSIAVPADGLPVISYYGGGNTVLKLAKCNNANCTAPTLRTLDTAGNVGLYSRIAIGQDGLPVIAYYDNTNSALKLAHCHSADCASATLTTVDNTGSVGRYLSLTIGTSGPVISYIDSSAGKWDVKLAYCHNADCSSATLRVVDGAGQIDGYTALVIGTEGLPVVAYREVNTPAFRITQCSSITCLEP